MINDSENLYYKSPAKAWVEALPLGNGALGAMVYGKTDTEIISMNSDTLWSGYPREPRCESDTYENYVEARKLALDGKYKEAQKLLEKKCLGNWTQAYMPLCDIRIKFDTLGFQKSYERILNLEEGLHTVSYKRGVTGFTRESFVSFPDNAYIEKITADKCGALSFTVSLKSKLKATSFAENSTVILDGVCPSDSQPNQQSYGEKVRGKLYPEEKEKQGIHFRAAVEVKTDGDTLYEADYVKVTGATTAYIYFTTDNSFNGYDKHPTLEGKEYKNSCIDLLKAVSEKDYDDVKNAHIADFSSFFNRVKIDIGTDNCGDIPTNKRLTLHNGGKSDIALYTLMFNFGRYLIIAGSREGTQPTNLQGIWNDKISPPWNSNYTVNINTEMNYWPVLPCNLSEFNMPLVEMMKDLSVVGEKTAQKRYHASGFCAHHNVDLWRYSDPVDGSATWALWPMSGGWLCEHLYNHYLYTSDIDYLKNTAYPIMKKACEFYLDMLVEDKDGYLICAPSTSPENEFKYGSEKTSVSETTTMTMSIIKELFRNTSKASKKLGVDSDFESMLEEKFAKLLPFKTGSKGQLLEWYRDEEETEPHHRHKSHLYGLHPADLITPDETPDLAAACRKTLELRGDNGTGWSLGWKINMWARLWDGDHALKLLDMQLNPVSPKKVIYHGGGTYPNLFDAHPPFQIDGNYGCASGICEMLLQSRPGKIFLLPALPSSWKNGSVSGLKAMGNITVSITWKDGKMTDYSLDGDLSGIDVYYQSEKLR